MEVPTELRDLPHWVCWRWAQRDGKQTKVPIDPNGGRHAKVNDPATWASCEVALEAQTGLTCDGVGFVFVKGDGIVFIDFDHCRDPQTGGIAPAAAEAVRSLDSYTEVSPSGTGLHCACARAASYQSESQATGDRSGQARWRSMTACATRA